MLLCPWGFSRQEYWSVLPCPSPGDLPHPGIELVSHSPALAGGFFTTSTTGSRTIIIFLRPELCSYLVTESCPTLCDPTSLLCLWDFPGENSGVGCHFLLQEIFPIQGSNPSLLHWQMDSLPSPWGSPKAKIHLLIFRINWSLKTKPQ